MEHPDENVPPATSSKKSLILLALTFAIAAAGFVFHLDAIKSENTQPLKEKPSTTVTYPVMQKN